MAAPAKLQPALLSGLFIGIVSALPFVNFLNCCCGWVIVGGALAAYLMQQNHPEPIAAGDGALVGLMAGVVGGIVGGLLSIPIAFLVGPLQAGMFERILEMAQQPVPPEAREMIEKMRNPSFDGVALAFQVALIGLWMFLGAIFGLLGGLLGAVMFRKNVPPAPPPPTFQAPQWTPPTFTPPAPPPPPPPIDPAP
jgi:hypothetical protein